MKMLIAAAAISALIASPILAASGPDQAKAAKTHATNKTHATKRVVKQARPARIPSLADTRFIHRPEYDVYVNGEYAGSDPDPRVRLMIQREYECTEIFSGC